MTKYVQRGVLQATVLSFSLSLSEQKASILYYRVYIDTRDISAQYLLVQTVLQLCSQVNFSLIKAACPVFKHVYNFKTHLERSCQMDNWK